MSDKQLQFKGIWHHYTIGPKDDMPLDLFLAILKVVAAAAKRSV